MHCFNRFETVDLADHLTGRMTHLRVNSFVALPWSASGEKNRDNRQPGSIYLTKHTIISMTILSVPATIIRRWLSPWFRVNPGLRGTSAKSLKNFEFSSILLIELSKD